MVKYFENFPQITYDGRKVRDITRRNRFLKTLTTNPYVFLPYTIKEGERAEDIANDYYGSVDYVWLVYMANNIIDPYHEWPMDQRTFQNYIIDKYREQSGREGNAVIDWTQEDDDANVIYYYKEV